MRRIWQDETGSVTLEWIFVLAVLIIGIIGGFAILRDSLILEAGETANAVLHVETGYSVSAPVTITMTHMTGKANLASATMPGFEHGSTVTNVTVVTDETLVGD